MKTQTSVFKAYYFCTLLYAILIQKRVVTLVRNNLNIIVMVQYKLLYFSYYKYLQPVNKCAIHNTLNIYMKIEI